MNKRKFKINMIIGKKQIILAGLTLILGVGIYINYLAASSGVDVDAETDSTAKITENAGEAEKTVNYGDLAFVSSSDSEKDSGVNADSVPAAEISDSNEYFAQARLDRQESRDEALEILQSMYLGGDSTSGELAVIAQDTVSLSSYVEKESKIENLLKAQGFADVLCYLTDTAANIIVKTDGLDKAQAAQIKNALLGEVTIPAENITIVEIK